MKHTLRLGLVALVSASSVIANDISRSFFSVRPFTENPHFSIENAVIGQATNTAHVLKMTTMQAIPFASVSTRSEELAKYFFFDGKSELVARETAPGNDAAEFNQDVLTENFNINTDGGNFHSTFTIKPKQSIYGVNLNTRRYFNETIWFGMEAPIVHVKNDLNFEETVVTASTAAGTAGIGGASHVATMKDAFKQSAMRYGRIDGAQSKTRLADLTLKVGYDSPMLNRKDLYMTSFAGLILPTGNKAQGVYMFEPICGNGGHAGVMFGNHGEVDIKKFKNGTFWMSWGVESQYLFENTQKRSFDLKLNGAWSRYLSMYETAAKETAGGVENANFGINLLTQDAKVTPGYNGTIHSALTYVREKWHIGASYSTHIRQAEKVKLANAWNYTEATITSYAFTADESNRFRRIGKSLNACRQDNAEEEITLTQSDIDLTSAAHPAAVSNTFALVGGMHHSCQGRPYLIEGGASYEFSRQNTALNRWGMWLTIQGSF